MDFWTVTLMLLFIMDPVGNIPMFHHILDHIEPKHRWRIILRELLFAYLILSAFLWGGQHILSFLGLKQASLSITGGIILFVIALDLVFPRKKGKGDDLDNEDPFIVPLAMPMLAGPSAMATLILVATKDPANIWHWHLALTTACTITGVILVSSNLILKFLGKRGIRALKKLIGMLLIMIAVQMFLDGVKEYLGL